MLEKYESHNFKLFNFFISIYIQATMMSILGFFCFNQTNKRRKNMRRKNKQTKEDSGEKSQKCKGTVGMGIIK